MKKSLAAVGCLVMLLAVSGLARAADVCFSLDNSTVAVGEKIKVTFDSPLPKDGDRHWITVIPANEGDDGWGQWKYVDAGVREIILDGPTSAGAFEVRLHNKYPAMGYHVICRRPLTAKSGGGAQPSGAVSLSLSKSAINKGQKPYVTFSMPLPKDGEKYWITVCPAGAADSEWGQWRYIDAGVKEIELEAVPAAGAYEVRLHDRYSELSYHVIARQPLTVK